MTDDLAFASAAELAALIARRAVSPVEVVEGVLARIEKTQPVLNAFITVCAEEARAAARRRWPPGSRPSASAPMAAGGAASRPPAAGLSASSRRLAWCRTI